MPRTAGSLRTDPAARLAELERRRPEWQTWLSLVGTSVRALHDDDRWMPLDEAELSTASVEPEGAPLLHGRTLHVDASRVGRLVRSLAATASEETWKAE